MTEPTRTPDTVLAETLARLPQWPVTVWRVILVVFVTLAALYVGRIILVAGAMVSVGDFDPIALLDVVLVWK